MISPKDARLVSQLREMADRIESGKLIFYAYVYCADPATDPMYFAHEGFGPTEAIVGALTCLIEDAKRASRAVS